MSIFQAIQAGDLRQLDDILSESSHLMNERNTSGQTPLMAAFTSPCAQEMVEIFRRHGATLESTDDSYNLETLYAAAVFGVADMLWRELTAWCRSAIAVVSDHWMEFVPRPPCAFNISCVPTIRIVDTSWLDTVTSVEFVGFYEQLMVIQLWYMLRGNFPREDIVAFLSQPAVSRALENADMSGRLVWWRSTWSCVWYAMLVQNFGMFEYLYERFHSLRRLLFRFSYEPSKIVYHENRTNKTRFAIVSSPRHEPICEQYENDCLQGDAICRWIFNYFGMPHDATLIAESYIDLSLDAEFVRSKKLKPLDDPLVQSAKWSAIAHEMECRRAPPHTCPHALVWTWAINTPTSSDEVVFEAWIDDKFFYSEDFADHAFEGQFF